MSNYQVSAAFTFPRFLNTLGLTGITFVLAFAFVWQFAYNELPCPLCLLQRAA
ncbi:MAG: disulfide bond formation protein B, partial [Pusillimonas sp.]|nr:disulfide bond formation protein B [Pusillimonas sp.]